MCYYHISQQGAIDQHQKPAACLMSQLTPVNHQPPQVGQGGNNHINVNMWIINNFSTPQEHEISGNAQG